MKYTVDTDQLCDILDKMEKNQEVLVRWYSDSFVQYYCCSKYDFLATLRYSVDDLPGARRRQFKPQCTVEFGNTVSELLFVLQYGSLG